MNQVINIASNIEAVHGHIDAACQRAGRSPQEVILIAVSKTMPPDLILAAMEAGLVHFGENRIEEAIDKIPLVEAQAATSPLWHMIGHVQSRKAREVVDLGFELVHSLDTLKLAQRYDRFAGELGVTLGVLLEVNVSGEEAKYGWNAVGWESNPLVRAQLWQDVEDLLNLPHLRIEGLMTMAPYQAPPEDIRQVFRSLADLRHELRKSFGGNNWQHLSMGMTDDFEIAIEEGATLVRIGRAIFGERQL
jgi:hypothetical protein